MSTTTAVTVAGIFKMLTRLEGKLDRLIASTALSSVPRERDSAGAMHQDRMTSPAQASDLRKRIANA